MAYQATVIPVMIASPGDVFEEREIVREVVHSWNDINSSRKKIVLIPAGWETHSSPELGSRPQELINSRILRACDLLIGVFWTRLGSPTGKAESGTVEEIEEHIKAGKPAMIYFSSKPVAPQSIDQEQYKALQTFKSKCRQKGLVEEFDNLLEFKDKVARQLQICLHDNPYIQSLLPNSAPYTDNQSLTANTGSLQSSVAKLSHEARVLLKTASKDKYGTILKIEEFGGPSIEVGGIPFGGKSARDYAKWEYALNELLKLKLIVARGGKGGGFELTHEGWTLADTLPDDL